MRRSLVLLPLLFLLAASFTGEVWNTITVKEYDAAMSKMEQFYSSKKTYSLKVTHASFKGHDTEVPYDVSSGYFHFDRGNYHSFLLGIHTIQNQKYKVVVDSINRCITVSDPDAASTKELMRINYVNSSQYVVAYKEAKTEQGEKYKLDFNEQPAYSAYTIIIGEDGQMKEMNVYYRKEYPSDNNNPSSPKVKPRLRISYSGFTEVSGFSQDEFQTDRYFREEKKVLKAAPAFAQWKLVDARLPKK